MNIKKITGAFLAAAAVVIAPLANVATAAPASADIYRCENFVNISAGGYWVKYGDDGHYIGWTNEGCWNLGQTVHVPG